MKKKQATTSDRSRREFLKGAAVAGGAVAVVAATGHNVMASETQAPEVSEKKSRGYQETQHVKDYYASLRN